MFDRDGQRLVPIDLETSPGATTPDPSDDGFPASVRKLRLPDADRAPPEEHRMPSTDEPNLPRGWPETVRSGVLHALALANVVLSHIASIKRGATNDLQGDRANAVLRGIDQLRKDRMQRVPPRLRPNYTPQERMQILEWKALEGWSIARTAEIFQVTGPTVAAWLAASTNKGRKRSFKRPSR